MNEEENISFYDILKEFYKFFVTAILKMNQRSRIMIVDDDVNICELVRLYLEKEGYETYICHNGNEAIINHSKYNPNLIILDIMLPGADGWTVCREIRKSHATPIIMLTARGDTFDKVLGLELGADDYLVKPFDTKELVARVKAVLRRFGNNSTEQNEVILDNLTINKVNYTVKVNGEFIEMPPKEFDLLFFLASNHGKVFTRDQILENVWGIDYFGDTRTVDVHIKRLREKIECPGQEWQIKTVWGVGYKLDKTSIR